MRLKKRGGIETSCVCNNTDTKIRVSLKKNILILLNTAERSIMVRTGNAVDFIVWQGVLLLLQLK